LKQGKIQWAFNSDGIFFTTPILKDSVLIINSSYFGSHGTLYFMNCKNGQYINGYGFSKTSPTSPALSGDVLYIGDGYGRLYALDYHNLLNLHFRKEIVAGSQHDFMIVRHYICQGTNRQIGNTLAKIAKNSACIYLD